MLEDFINAATAERLRSCLFGEHVETFCASLLESGYSRATVSHKLCYVGVLARWMADEGFAITDLDGNRLARFLIARRAAGRTCRSLQKTGLMLIEHLRAAHAIPAPELAQDESQHATLLRQYAAYLQQERAVTNGIVVEYTALAQNFMKDRPHSEGAQIDPVDADDVQDFLADRVHRVCAKRAQVLCSALRSFLRFLFARGETRTDLSLAVLTVRQRRSSSVPRHMPSEDVERLLRSCDRSSPTGRRNHAILLLLARLGLRACEVIALELDDLRWREGEMIIRGKGRVRDRLPLLQDVGEAIALYLRKDRPAAASRRVFLCRRAPHRGLGHPSTVSTIVMRALAQAGLSPATRGAHLLRHSLATAMVRRGASLAEIGQVLRHRSPNTTEIYAKLDFGALRDIGMPWPGLGGAR